MRLQNGWFFYWIKSQSKMDDEQGYHHDLGNQTSKITTLGKASN